MKKCVRPLALILVILINTLLASADVRLPAIFGSHMVLQQNSEIKIWGWGDPGEKIRVKVDWDTATFNSSATGDAKWVLVFKTPAAGGPHSITVSGRNTIVLDDVLIGETWLCSGQSNMDMSINWGIKLYDAEVAAANNKSIRFFNVAKTSAEYPQDDLRGQWVVCTPQTMRGFSVVGYFFGDKLNNQLNVPVGLINSSWGGTPAEIWTPKEMVESNPELKKDADKRKPGSNIYGPEQPGHAYNAMISPITNFNIAGVIWYQGEANIGASENYQLLMSTLIGSWRKAWQKDFPFYYVQIAPFAGYGNNNTSPLLREAQTKTLASPNTGMVVIHDLVDDINDIHPKMKKEVGVRLANLALAEAYGKDIVYKSPQYKSMKVEKRKIRIHFDNAGNGLITKGGAPTEVFIAGEDKVFVPATAKIEGNTLVAYNKNIANPVAVRFGFSNAAMPNLYSKEGLPVNIFRTDDWPEDTIEVKK